MKNELAKNILKKYWGHSNFRPLQEEIINTVLQKKDTIVLLPPSGGKSICFQIPALINAGTCLVISPLISLMKDQTQSLSNKKIKSVYFPSEMSSRKIVPLLSNTELGDVKFIYISPERLQSKLIQQKLIELKINLIAVDESHCISEWGHDFRPSYRNISVLKTLFPNINFVVLTATANDKVIEDISTNLKLNNPIIYKSTYHRGNLAYHFYFIENKLQRLLQIFNKTKNPAIVYVNRRAKASQISNFLNRNNFKSTFYHAGLSMKEKNAAFENWTKEKAPIIVATNAFGMGIDKENVQLVVHYDIPFSIESYVQEAGRAGRNNQKSFAILLYDTADIDHFNEVMDKEIVNIGEIKTIHKKLHQYFKIALSDLSDILYNFNISEFCEKYNFTASKVNQAFKILENNNILKIYDFNDKKSRVKFKVSSISIIKYAENIKVLKAIVYIILRNYPGIFEKETAIDEYFIAKTVGITKNQVVANLEELQRREFLSYNIANEKTKIKFLQPREDDFTINRCAKDIKKFLSYKKKKSRSMINFIENKNICRSVQILNYFDEYSTKKCNICDVCVSKQSKPNKDIYNEIIALLKNNKSLSSVEICGILESDEKNILTQIDLLLNKNKILIDCQNKYQLIN